MIKPRKLREALEAAVPALGDNPDMLAMFIDKGAITTASGINLAFRYEYTLNLVITGWTGHTAALVLPINLWLAQHQPELVAGNRPSYTFEADIIDAQTADLSFELALSEAMSVTPRANGGFDLLPENTDGPLFPDVVPVSDPVALLKQLWWRDERLLPEPPLEPAP